jgi:type I restriction enzyme S subunit
LAPYNEQVRIVARLEELFARLGAGIEGLRKVKVQLKRYRQAVLKYAFEGKLTEEHRDNSVCDEKLGWAIPADWGLKPAKELFYIKGRIGWRGLKKSHFTNEGPYLITGVDFTDGKIDWEKCYHIPLDKYLESPEIFTQKDDILLTKDGTIGKVAYVGHVPGGQASINAHILLIRNLQNNGIFAKFIYYMLQTRYFFDFVDLKKIGTTRPALTQRAFEEFPVFYPSLEKQKRIVEKIEDCLSIVDHIYETLKLSLTQARELRQSILEKAFRGELVPHDPHDEPAEQLLERIRVEMAKSQGGKDINKKKIKPKQLELSSYVK